VGCVKHTPPPPQCAGARDVYIGVYLLIYLNLRLEEMDIRFSKAHLSSGCGCLPVRSHHRACFTFIVNVFFQPTCITQRSSFFTPSQPSFPNLQRGCGGSLLPRRARRRGEGPQPQLAKAYLYGGGMFTGL
jgi:hypothetical protein